MIEPCDKLLDCCAAPGGKSVRLSYKCGEVTSCDVYEHRVNLISEYADRMNRKNITLLLSDATEREERFIEKLRHIGKKKTA